MKFCTNCGKPINGEKFCTKCGASVSSGSESPVYVNNANKPKKRVLGKLIVVIVVIGIIVAAFFLLKGRSYEALIKDYVDASIKGDAEKIISLMPDSFIDYIAEEEYDGDKDDMISDLEGYLGDIVDKIEDYDIDISKISYEIVEVEDIEDDDVDDLEDEYRRAKLDIKEGKRLEVELKIPVNGKEQTDSIYLDVVKIGRSWYIIDM